MTTKEFSDFVEAQWIGCEELPKRNLVDLFICTSGIAGECGEVCEKMKKYVRDGKLDESLLIKEMGDVLYYLVALALMFGSSLEIVMEENVKKLRDRKSRGVMQGEGDSR